MSKGRDMQELRARLNAQGFTVERVRNGHYKVTAPTGRKAQIAATPGNNRAVLNAITRLKRIGFQPTRP
jgi:predicted RNA binding protein YcfA (HicA-like mRNA interferase family)